MADIKRALSPEANGGGEIVAKKQRLDDGDLVVGPAKPETTKEVCVHLSAL